MPGLLPLGVTRLYTHSLSQIFVLMFQESSKVLKFEGSSTSSILMFVAPSQRDSPDGPNPVKPSPVKILAP